MKKVGSEEEVYRVLVCRRAMLKPTGGVVEQLAHALAPGRDESWQDFPLE